MNTYRGINYIYPNRYNLTHQHIHNLIDTAHLVRNSPPPNFDMEDFAMVETKSKKFDGETRIFEVSPFMLSNIRTDNVCQTSCCAVGTAAFHGVGSPEQCDSWTDYVSQTYGLDFFEEAAQFMFGSGWSYRDNTEQGAAARILQFVITGDSSYSYNDSDSASYDEYKNVEITD